jgi:NAD(P)-dependent dehydrogenase (short-subunit alcohol dehydrogenase family)
MIVFLILASIFIFLIVINKFFLRTAQNSIEKLSESQIHPITRTVIITGGNSGLGYHWIEKIALANQGFKVILACMSEERAKKAVLQLIHDTGNSNISYLLLDLASFDSIRKFVDNFLNEHPLFGFICNAAASEGNSQEFSLTQDKIEITFGVNLLGHFLLANLLLPLISDQGRVVFVSSDMHNPPSFDSSKFTFIDPEILAHPSQTQVKGMQRYSLSKLCNIYCTYEMALRIKQNATVNAFNPAFMPETKDSRDANIVVKFLIQFIFPIFAYLAGRLGSLQNSSQELAKMIFDEKYDGMTGKYIDRGREIRSSELSYDLENARRLWEYSSQLCGIEYN